MTNIVLRRAGWPKNIFVLKRFYGSCSLKPILRKTGVHFLSVYAQGPLLVWLSDVERFGSIDIGGLITPTGSALGDERERKAYPVQRSSVESFYESRAAVTIQFKRR